MNDEKSTKSACTRTVDSDGRGIHKLKLDTILQSKVIVMRKTQTVGFCAII